MKIKLSIVSIFFMVGAALAEDYSNPVIFEDSDPLTDVRNRAAINNAQIERQNNINNAILFDAMKNSAQTKQSNPYFNPYINSAPVVVAPNGGQNGVVVDGVFYPTR